MIKTVYDKELQLNGSCTVTLTEEERRIICNAMAIVLPKETNALPIILLTDKIIKGDQYQ